MLYHTILRPHNYPASHPALAPTIQALTVSFVDGRVAIFLEVAVPSAARALIVSEPVAGVWYRMPVPVDDDISSNTLRRDSKKVGE